MDFLLLGWRYDNCHNCQRHRLATGRFRAFYDQFDVPREVYQFLLQFQTGKFEIVFAVSLVSKLTLTFTWITQMKRLLDIMREDWEIYKKLRNEYDLLCEQYAIGKKITVSFVGKATLQLAIQRLKVINTVSISYVLTF